MQPGGHHQLRVAIASESELQRANLKLMLERSGLQVVVTRPLSDDFLNQVSENIADVLLIDLDDTIDEDMDLLDQLLEQSQLPILFNDSAATRQSALVFDADVGKKLASKLVSLVGGGQLSVEDAQHAIALETPDYAPQPAYGVSTEQGVPASKVVASETARNVWVLGASIGGPQSVKRFLSAIPEDLPVAFIVAQHIGGNFVALLAEQLNRVTKFEVYPPVAGRLLYHREVVIAPVHERITFGADGDIRLEPAEAVGRYSPSIDRVMSDVARRYGARTGAIMFSGMGNDGLGGCHAVAAAGGPVWAQDAASCVISSMPDSVRHAGVASLSGAPEELAACLVERIM